VIQHARVLRKPEIENDQRDGNNGRGDICHPEQLLLFAITEVDRNGSQTIKTMKGKKDQNKDIQNGVPVQAERPVGLLIFREKEKTGEDFDAEQNDQGHAADAVKKPDEHTPPCLISGK
jgi:hypothetical protein